MRTLAKGRQCGPPRLVLMLAFAVVHGRPARIVKLVWLAGPSDTAYSRPALLDRREAAIRRAPHVAAVDGAPRIRVVRHLIGACRRSDDGRHSEGQSSEGIQTHGKVSFCSR